MDAAGRLDTARCNSPDLRLEMTAVWSTGSTQAARALVMNMCKQLLIVLPSISKQDANAVPQAARALAVKMCKNMHTILPPMRRQNANAVPQAAHALVMKMCKKCTWSCPL